MGHGISLGFETPKELHHSNSTRGIVIDRYWPILTWRIGVSAIGAEVAATGRPDMVDPALMRPGRFDKICYCGQDLNRFFPFSQVPKHEDLRLLILCRGLPSDDEKLEICQVLARLKLQRLRGIVFCLSDVFLSEAHQKTCE